MPGADRSASQATPTPRQDPRATAVEQFLTLLIDFLLRCPPSFLINFIKKEGKGLDDEPW